MAYKKSPFKRPRGYRQEGRDRKNRVLKKKFFEELKLYSSELGAQ